MKKLLLLITGLFILASVEGQILRYSNYTAPAIDYEFEVDRYNDALTTPLSTTNLGYINTFVKRLKDSLAIDSLAVMFDVMYIHANQTSEAGTKNIVNRTNDATIVNSMEFTAYYGFWGNGTNSYLNTGYNPTSDGVVFSQNDATIGLFAMTDYNTTEAAVDCGSSTTNRTYGYIKATGTATSFCINTNIGTGTSFQTYWAKGMWIGTRTLSTGERVYKNNVETSLTVNSSGLANGNFYIGAREEGGSPLYPAKREYALFFAGKGVDSSQACIITNAFNAYLDNINSNPWFVTIETSPSDFDAQQGYSWDGTYHYLIDDLNHYVYKKNDDATWSTVGDSVNYFTSTALDKGGDGDYYNGKLYLVGHTVSERANQSILVVNATTMVLDSIHDISGDVAALSNLGGLTVDPDDGDNGIIYIVNFDEETSIYQFDLLTFDYIGALTLPYPIVGMQGVTTKGDWFYITQHNNPSEAIHRVKKDMSKADIILWNDYSTTGEMEGIDYSSEYLRYGQLYDYSQRICIIDVDLQ